MYWKAFMKTLNPANILCNFIMFALYVLFLKYDPIQDPIVTIIVTVMFIVIYNALLDDISRHGVIIPSVLLSFAIAMTIMLNLVWSTIDMTSFAFKALLFFTVFSYLGFFGSFRFYYDLLLRKVKFE